MRLFAVLALFACATVHRDRLGRCSPQTGLAAPLPECSAEHPCRARSGRSVRAPFTPPVCRTTERGRAPFDDGAPLAWQDGGETRMACVFRPPGAGPASKRPLVIFLHGAGGAASGIYDNLSLRAKAPTFDLSGDPARPGFVLAAQQGRNLHGFGLEGAKHDTWFHDLASPSRNPDVRALDALVDALAGEGDVDPDRIYVVGWSNGGFMAQLYAIARHDRPTPGGHRVAAAVAYAASDPFADPSDGAAPVCAGAPPPATQVPVLVVHRDCDALVPCSPGGSVMRQAAPPVSPWIWRLRDELGDPNVSELLLDAAGRQGPRCAASCGGVLGVENHLRWPDGVADRSGRDWEPAMLRFLREHPLAGGAK